VIYHSSLRRTQETATIIAEGYETLGRSRPPCRLRHAFDEADYGEDDGRPEEEVRARLGDALLRWETEAVVPEGWSLDPEAVALMWRDFGRELWLRFGSGGVEAGQGMPWVVVVTSQGIARFSDSLLGVARPGLTAKLGTAHGIVYVGYEEAWSCSAWNIPASGIGAVMASLQGKFSLECD
jgi:probable phosphoglycerate mutase